MYYENGSKSFDGGIANGFINGECDEFYKSGNKKFSGYFKDGVKHGSGKAYFDKLTPEKKEIVQFTGEYENDLKNGHFTESYITGEKKYVGYFESDLKNGEGQ